MLIERLRDWKSRLEKRNDLLSLIDHKNLIIQIENGSECGYVIIQNGHVSITHVLPEDFSQEVMVIAGTEKACNELINGKSFLSQIPGNHLEANGHYKDLLLVESLFGLAV
ncbi:hypothetical protein EDD68_11957 [Melghiribacillus thermohalophilus]|uniref:SCP-2 sterol transfer family protein n=1 Tax=Melghiribacillus thermohalophilus TaxID=1324956 RepID=A0A4R3MTQ7_9BACI|nr:hypothetical protein [Melghiribacillus thermohalophilus]TCT19107.1 hypothetical protein EDD68_11957 [Melghiribacillus thermohalophilus]